MNLAHEFLKRFGVTALFANTNEVFEATRKAESRRTEKVCIWILVAKDTPTDLALAVRDAFIPELSSAAVHVARLGEKEVNASDKADALIIVCGESRLHVAPAVATAASCGIPVAVLAESEREMPAFGLPKPVSAFVKVIRGTSPQKILARLAPWISEMSEKGIALSANFRFCRRAEANLLIRECAQENALVGALGSVVGSEMPVMTGNQARLAFNIAAAYGKSPEAARIPDIAGVVLAGIGYRTLARLVARGDSRLGLSMRAALGYAGTQLTGHALTAHLATTGDGLIYWLRKLAYVLRDAREEKATKVTHDLSRPALPGTMAKEESK